MIAATAINTARNNGIGASNAPQSTALLFGGNTGSDTGKTEQYNGTTWTEIADMATARDSLAGSGIGTAALAAGGAPPPGNVAIAEEFNQSINTITAGAFASTPNLNSSYNQRTGSGVTDACLCFGGEGPPGVQAINESFDGSSWSLSASEFSSPLLFTLIGSFPCSIPDTAFGPIAVISVLISSLAKILSKRAFSTLSTFPLNGKIA